MRRAIILLLVLSAGILSAKAARRMYSDRTSASAPTSAPATPNGSTWESYGVIVTRNMFVSDRGKLLRVQRTYTSRRPRTSTQSLVLTGVAVQPPDTFAFFEDTRTGDTLRVSVGEAVGNGTLASVSLDGIEFLDNNVARKISIGQTLSGDSISLVYAPLTSQPTTGEADEGDVEATSQPASTGNISSNDLLERMRQRRLQENR
jgi:hypothetical protein